MHDERSSCQMGLEKSASKCKDVDDPSFIARVLSTHLNTYEYDALSVAMGQKEG